MSVSHITDKIRRAAAALAAALTVSSISIITAVSPLNPAVLQVQAAAAKTEEKEKTDTETDTASLLTEHNHEVFGNAIAAVENGGFVYGNKIYTAYAPAFNATANELTCTLGWCSLYGANAQRLIQRLHDTDPDTFASIDTNGIILNRLSQNWHTTRWDPDETEKALLLEMIDTPTGHELQDEIFDEITDSVTDHCFKKYGVTDQRSLMMYAEMAMLGGQGAADRVFDRCGGHYDVDSIIDSLFLDYDGTNAGATMVGSPMYWQRHIMFEMYINEYGKYAFPTGSIVS